MRKLSEREVGNNRKGIRHGLRSLCGGEELRVVLAAVGVPVQSIAL